MNFDFEILRVDCISNNHLFHTAGQCFFRSFTQTVLHSKASDSCESPSISSVSGNLSQCTAQCVSLSQRCTMLEADGETQECNFYSACTDVMVWNADTRISVRKSCTAGIYVKMTSYRRQCDVMTSH